MAPIDDYAIIGDCRSAALVSRHGSIDWLCWPRFDSPSIFGALLDDAAGRWVVAPTPPARPRRQYIDGTNVLQTRFDCADGIVTVTDFMPVASNADKRRLLLPEHELVRIVGCEAGAVDVETLFDARPGYAQRAVRIRDAKRLGIRIERSGALLTLRSDRLPLTVGDGVVRGKVRLSAGESAQLSLVYAHEWPAILPLEETGALALERTIRWWREWSARLQYDGPRRDAVIRSALALRLMVYAPSGAVVAAPTTSLPERIGGDLNWDYRYCWLRDAAFTVRALFGLGCSEEAESFVSWLIHSTRLTRPKLRVLYDVFGCKPAAERILEPLGGYLGSKPVRVGNAAVDQLQLDVYGEVLDAVVQLVARDGTIDREVRRLLCDFGEYVCRNWNQPDAGIWEPRAAPAHNTHSRLLCWVALDRLLQLASAGLLPGAPVDRFARNRQLIAAEIEARAWNSREQSYVSRLDGDDVDATLLLLPWYGLIEATSPRMRATYARVRERLGAGDGLLYRNRDVAGEGAFGICSFWNAEFLARGGGSVDEALRSFNRVCDAANDVGLFAEEVDAATGAALGNFPQAFTHVGLINAALSIAERLADERGERRAAVDGQRQVQP